MASSLIRPRLWNAFVRMVGDNHQKQKAIERVVTPPGRLPEIGCATGNLAEAFTEFDYVGIDTDEELVRFAAHRLRRSNFRFLCLDLLESDPDLGAQFDYLLISHTAHHLPDDYFGRLIRRSADLLVPSGQLVVLDMLRPDRDASFKKQFYQRLDRGRYFRTIEEFGALLADQTVLDAPRFQVVRTTKFGIEVIDQVLIDARKAQ